MLLLNNLATKVKKQCQQFIHNDKLNALNIRTVKLIKALYATWKIHNGCIYELVIFLNRYQLMEFKSQGGREKSKT